jgi:hypothetical protein
MLTKLSIITSKILNHEISQLYVMWKSGHFVVWNSFGIAETPDEGCTELLGLFWTIVRILSNLSDDGCSRPKHVVKGRSDSNSCIVNGIILCITVKICHYRRFLNWDIVYLFALWVTRTSRILRETIIFDLIAGALCKALCHQPN